MNLKKGNKVMIWQDPFTKLKKEGEAILIKRVYDFGGMPPSELWTVRFTDNGDIVDRVIFE